MTRLRRCRGGGVSGGRGFADMALQTGCMLLSELAARLAALDHCSPMYTSITNTMWEIMSSASESTGLGARSEITSTTCTYKYYQYIAV